MTSDRLQSFLAGGHSACNGTVIVPEPISLPPNRVGIDLNSETEPGQDVLSLYRVLSTKHLLRYFLWRRVISQSYSV